MWGGIAGGTGRGDIDYSLQGGQTVVGTTAYLSLACCTEEGCDEQVGQ